MINPSEFIHPEDAAAQKTLEALPGFSLFTKKFMEYGLELMYYGSNIASSISFVSYTATSNIQVFTSNLCETWD